MILYIFPLIFAIFDDFSKFCSSFDVLYFEKSSNMAKKLVKNEESLVQPFSPQYFGIPETQVLGTHSATNIHFKINVQTAYLVLIFTTPISIQLLLTPGGVRVQKYGM